MSKLVCTDYAQSQELRIIYGLLYPSGNFEEFIHRAWYGPNWPIHQDFYEACEVIRNHEPDFPLRQLLFFLRPSAQFRAWKECVKSLSRICEEVANSQTKKEEGEIPFSSLFKTAKAIEVLIEEHYPPESMGDLFPQFYPPKPRKKHARSQSFLSAGNPMYRTGCSSFPLYATLFNDRKQLLSESPIEEQGNTDKYYARFLSHLYRCANERRLIAIDPNRTQAAIDREIAYRNPYAFLLRRVESAPDHSKVCEIERIVRKASEDWLDYLLDKRVLIEKIISRPYDQFVRACDLLLLNPLFGDPVDQELIDLKEVLQFFTEVRRAGRNSGGGGGNPHGRTIQTAGHHLWIIPPIQVQHQEDVYGNPVEVYRLADEGISPERAIELEELGEHPFEDSMGDEASIEVLLMEEGATSQLKLEKHTSHTQLLLATQNQGLSWTQCKYSDEEIEAFLQFLNSQEGWAPKALLMTIILAIDLEMALSVELAPSQDYQWLSGKSRYQIKGAKETKARGTLSEPLRVCKITKNQTKGNEVQGPATADYFAAWVLPIPVPALKQYADIGKSDQYQTHLSTLGFHDQSGVALLLIEKHTSSVPTDSIALFSEPEKVLIRKQCTALLKEFNQELNDGITQTKGKRNLSLKVIREYGKNYLIQAGFEPTLTDALDWNLPSDITPATHYFTSPLWQSPKLSRLGLQYHLSERTAFFNDGYHQKLPGIGNHAMGATGLVKLEPVQAWIEKLLGAMPAYPHTICSRGDVKQFIAAFNSYSLYMALWFCMETSHRPHHTPFGDITKIDPMHNLLKIKDKSNSDGDKCRLVWVSESLREAMQSYAHNIAHLLSWASQEDIAITAPSPVTLIYLELDKQSSQHFSIHALRSNYFARQIRESLKIEANFYRKLMSSLLRSESTPLSAQDVERWLGHWTHGTAPYHLFSTASPVAYIRRLEVPLCSVIASLGFRPTPFQMPIFQIGTLKTQLLAA
jgi:hypothetical protein